MDNYFIVADTDSSRKEVGTAQQTIKTGQTAAIFDAYISASRDDKGEKYKYTIEVEYKGVNGYTTCAIDENASPISASASYSGKYFLMKVYSTKNGNRWIYKAQNGLVMTQNMTFDALRKQILDNKDYRFVWQIVRSGGNGNKTRYYLRNPVNGDYICKLSDPSSVNVGNNTNISVLTTSNNTGSAETFQISISGNTFIFCGDSNSQYMNNHGGYPNYMSYYSVGANDDNSRFQLYPVEFMDGTPCLRKEVVLQTIDNETSAVSDVTEIRRNDFVRILVEVSYNPDKGDFEFEVQPWETGKGGDITFN